MERPIFQPLFDRTPRLRLRCGGFDTCLEALAELLKLGRNDREAIRVPLPFAGPIVLVIVFGRPPFANWFDRRHDAAVMVGVVPDDRLARLALLLLVQREDRRSILSPDVIALTVELRRVMRPEEDVEQVVIADLRIVERDPDRLGVARVAAAHLLV